MQIHANGLMNIDRTHSALTALSDIVGIYKVSYHLKTKLLKNYYALQESLQVVCSG